MLKYISCLKAVLSNFQTFDLVTHKIWHLYMSIYCMPSQAAPTGNIPCLPFVWTLDDARISLTKNLKREVYLFLCNWMLKAHRYNNSCIKCIDFVALVHLINLCIYFVQCAIFFFFFLNLHIAFVVLYYFFSEVGFGSSHIFFYFVICIFFSLIVF